MSLRRSSVGVLAAAAVVAAVTVPASAQEAEGPSSAQVERRLTSAEDRLAELEAQASLAVEAVNEAQVALEQAEAELAETTDAAAAARGRTDELRVATDAVARSLYKTGGTNLQFGALLDAEGATEAGVRYATVQRVLRGHRGDVQALQAALTELGVLEDRLAEQRDAATERAAQVEQRRRDLEATFASQADEVAGLEDELRDARDREEAARRAAEEAARREAAARQAAREREQAAAREAAAAQEEAAAAARRETAPAPAPSGRSSSGSGSTSAGSSGGSSTPPAPSTRQSAQVAVDTALAQVGKPYQWGGSGPNSFDCSGLTSYGWRAAGVSLPHSSRMQYTATSRISRSQLQLGDLIFFGSPIHHVAMYIGGGSVVEASRSGVPVRVSSTALGRSDIAGYGRP